VPTTCVAWYYLSWSTCVAVWKWYYSPAGSITRTACPSWYTTSTTTSSAITQCVKWEGSGFIVCMSDNWQKAYGVTYCFDTSNNRVDDSQCTSAIWAKPVVRLNEYCCVTSRASLVAAPYRAAGANYIDLAWFQYRCNTGLIWTQLNCWIREGLRSAAVWDATVKANSRTLCNSNCPGYTCNY
jgi:hypothetical protein